MILDLQLLQICGIPALSHYFPCIQVEEMPIVVLGLVECSRAGHTAESFWTVVQNELLGKPLPHLFDDGIITLM